MAVFDSSEGSQRRPKWRLGWKALALGGLLLLALVLSGFTGSRNHLAASKEAPEAEQVLAAQRQLPFQVLIPGYLPYGFKREKMSLDVSLTGPAGEPMIQLSYPARQGGTLVLREWLPSNPDVASAASPPGTASHVRIVQCRCHTRSGTQCDLNDMEISVGSLHLVVKSSSPNLITLQQMQFILNTLGPAANRQIYTAMQDVPITVSLPAAVNVPLNSQGVQELTLVVTPQGYTPAHFAVKRGIPVRLTFRQLGQVGCGNELIFPWGEGKKVDITLTSEDDSQVIEFTPSQSGDFSFHCPHLIYQGAMTVQD